MKTQNKTGIAIALVLGFVVVAMIMGSSLIFLSRERAATTHRTLARIQLSHVAQMGVSAVLSEIKGKTLPELIKERGKKWENETSPIQVGKFKCWSSSSIELLSKKELSAVTTGFLQELGSDTPKEQTIYFNIKYSETKYYVSYNTVRLVGRWELSKVRQKQ